MVLGKAKGQGIKNLQAGRGNNSNWPVFGSSDGSILRADMRPIIHVLSSVMLS